MATSVQELGENRVRLTVDVSSDQVKHAVEHAVSDLSESAKIPGFRKGKIPTPVLISRLGKERIYSEAVDSHIGGWFWSAAARNRVRPVADPQYEFELPASADEAWSFAATVEVQPIPEIVDWTTLEVARPEAEVPQEAIDAEVEALRESVAELAPADGRPAQIGDTLVIDLVDPDGEAQRDTVVELGAGRLAEELESTLVGASAGDSKDVTYALSDGREVTVGVTVREVQEKRLPPLDDELARSASEFDTLADLRASIDQDLRAQLDAEIDAAYRVAAVDELVRASEVQPALPLVRSRAVDLLQGFVRSLERRGISLETYLAASGATSDDLQKQFVLEAAVPSRASSRSRRSPSARGSASPTTRSGRTCARKRRRPGRTRTRSSRMSGHTGTRSRSARTCVSAPRSTGSSPTSSRSRPISPPRATSCGPQTRKRPRQTRSCGPPAARRANESR